MGNKLSEHYYIVSYVSNTGNVDDSDWNPPKISQLAAAITACSRIHMYKFKFPDLTVMIQTPQF